MQTSATDHTSRTAVVTHPLDPGDAEVTSALRRLAPIGLSTDIVWTANLRTLRHVIEMRTSPGAEEELRLVFDQVAQIMTSEVPGLFQDFQRSEDGAWRPEQQRRGHAQSPAAHRSIGRAWRHLR